jgi:hypothetical protein
MATYDQLTEWAGPGHVTRAGRDVVAGWWIPDSMKAQLVEVGIPVAPRLIERVVMQNEADPVLLTSRGPLYRLTEQVDPDEAAERSSFGASSRRPGRSASSWRTRKHGSPTRVSRYGSTSFTVTAPVPVLLGIPVSDVLVDLNALLLYQRHYCGSLGATEPETDFPLFLEWVREDRFPLGKLVTDRYPLDQIQEACVALEEGRILGRAIVEI